MSAPSRRPNRTLRERIGKVEGSSLTLKAQGRFPTGSLKHALFHVSSKTDTQTEGQGVEMEKLKDRAWPLRLRSGFQQVSQKLPFSMSAPDRSPNRKLRERIGKVEGTSLILKAQGLFLTDSLKPCLFHVSSQADAQTED